MKSKFLQIFSREYFLLGLIITFFAISYLILVFLRHQHFQSFGYDLGIADQTIWQYSQFSSPISSIDHIPFVSELFTHIELIFVLLAPFYWIYNNVLTLLILQVIFVTISSIPIYLLAKKHTASSFLGYVLTISYLIFYGVQNAIWFDAHSNVFGTSLLTWFIYFVDIQQFRLSLIFLLLTIVCKENFAAMTFLISGVYFLFRKDRTQIIFMSISLVYIIIVFGIYFPLFVPGGYHFQNHGGFFSNISLTNFLNTPEKRQVIFTTFTWTGYTALLNPLFIIPLLGNLALYFILGKDVTTAQGMFLQYRIELAPLLFWATIYGLEKLRKIPSIAIGIYILLFACYFQYSLHLPLSYLSKSWLWYTPSLVTTFPEIEKRIPSHAPLVTQNNIVPHVSHRNIIVELYPTIIDDKQNVFCEKKSCDWFTWAGNPTYLLVDTSSEWDIRHLLTTPDHFIAGLTNLEKNKIITLIHQEGNTKLYRINKHP